MPNNNALKANYVYYIQKGYTKGHISRLQEYKKDLVLKERKNETYKRKKGKMVNSVDLEEKFEP